MMVSGKCKRCHMKSNVPLETLHMCANFVWTGIVTTHPTRLKYNMTYACACVYDACVYDACVYNDKHMYADKPARSMTDELQACMQSHITTC